MNKEEWVDVVGYESLYLISSHGRIFDIENESIKYPHISMFGYESIGLKKDNKWIIYSVHRLVAIAFISNVDNRPQVHHLDGVKVNNDKSNLKWVTPTEHARYTTDEGRTIKAETYRRNKALRKNKFGW